MNTSKFTLSALFLIASVSTLMGQDRLRREQKFNRQLDPQPLVGIEFLRLRNPSIIIQQVTDTSGSVKKNITRYKTVKHDIAPGALTESGIYDFDEISGTWKVNQVDKYDVMYNPTFKVVTQSYVDHLLPDASQNTTYKSLFILDNAHRADTERVYAISAQDTSIYSHFFFYYDSVGRLSHLTNRLADKSSYEIFISYDNADRIGRQLTLYSKSQFATIDSSARRTWTYNSRGLVDFYQEEHYGQRGLDIGWIIDRKTTFTYDTNGRLTADYVYFNNALNPDVPELKYVHQYTYDQQGMMREMTETINHNVINSSTTKLVIQYDAFMNATVGDEYLWNGNSFNTIPSRHFIFSQETTSIEAPVAKNALEMYPNPASRTLNISASRDIGQLRIYSIEGKLVYACDVPYNTTTIDVSSLSPGVYSVVCPHVISTRLIITQGT